MLSAFLISICHKFYFFFFLEKRDLHQRIAAGKGRRKRSKITTEKEFLTVRVNAPAKGTSKRVHRVVRLPFESGASTTVLEGITLEVGENPLGRSVVNVLGYKNRLIARRTIKPSNRSGFIGRKQELLNVSLSPNLNWCGYCGYVEKGHSCPHEG